MFYNSHCDAKPFSPTYACQALHSPNRRRKCQNAMMIARPPVDQMRTVGRTLLLRMGKDQTHQTPSHLLKSPPNKQHAPQRRFSTPLDIIEIKDTPCKVEIEENTSPNDDGLGVEETEGLPVQDVQEVVQQMSDMNLGGPESFEETQVEVPDQGWKEDQAVDPEWREKRMKKLKQELDAARKRMTSMTFV